MQRIIKIILLLGLLFNLVQQAESQQKKRQTKNSQSKTVQTKNLTAEQIAKKYLPSVVLIVCDDGKGNYSQGSGFFIRQGMILTNYHVIEDMVRGKVKTVSGDNKVNEWWIKKILYTDSKNDLALLSVIPELEIKKIQGIKDDSGNQKEKKLPEKKIKISKITDLEYDSVNIKPDWDIPALKLSESDEIKIGEAIFVLSNPKGLTGTISQGIVSSGIRKIKDIELLQIDAPISAGSSGGAVLNARGEVVGIATGSLSGGQNLNFAVPSPQIKSFLKRYDTDSSDKNYDFTKISELPNSWSKGDIVIYEGVKVLSLPRAVYTDEAEKNQVQGKVVLRVTFSANGSIGAITVISGLGNGLTEQAIAAARGIKFEPARKGGVPISVTKPVTYSFVINKKSPLPVVPTQQGLGSGLGQGNQKTQKNQPDETVDTSEPDAPKTEEKPKVTYDEIAQDLVTKLNNSKFKYSEKSVERVSSISFSGCSMKLKTSWIKNDDITTNLYDVNLKNLEDISYTSFSSEITMRVNLMFSRSIVERTEFGILEGMFSASLTKELSIPITLENLKAIPIGFQFMKLKELCSNTENKSEPTLKETTDWLTDTIEGTTFISNSTIYKYERLRFSECNATLAVRIQGEGVVWVETNQPSLRFLSSVEATKNTSGNWGVWLEFNRNFEVTSETFGYFGKKEFEKKDKITIFFDTKEKAQRVGSAFARMLELCGEEIKEPF